MQTLIMHPAPGSCPTGSLNVLANNIAVHRVGDSNTPMALYYVFCPTKKKKKNLTLHWIPNVYANTHPIGRIGDSYSCGIKVNAGPTKCDCKQLGIKMAQTILPGEDPRII